MTLNLTGTWTWLSFAFNFPGDSMCSLVWETPPYNGATLKGYNCILITDLWVSWCTVASPHSTRGPEVHSWAVFSPDPSPGSPGGLELVVFWLIPSPWHHNSLIFCTCLWASPWSCSSPLAFNSCINSSWQDPSLTPLCLIVLTSPISFPCS